MKLLTSAGILFALLGCLEGPSCWAWTTLPPSLLGNHPWTLLVGDGDSRSRSSSRSRVVFRSMSTFEQDNETIKHEIQEMRLEALRRIEALRVKRELLQSIKNSGSSSSSSSIRNHATREESSSLRSPRSQTTTTTPSHPSSSSSSLSVSSMTAERTTPSAVAKEKRTALLDDTQWKVVLNIGRGEDSNMPKTWGISGERLVLSLTLEFTKEPLQEKEEFLNGYVGSKVLKVVNQEGILAPSLNKGSKRFDIENGGWRIAKAEGPLGTDLVRFYVNVVEEVSHLGGDIYCPKGRVYGTCGYFPVVRRVDGGCIKETLRQEQEELGRHYEQLKREVDQDTNLVSWEKMVKSKKMLDIRAQTGKLTHQLRKARVREPDRSVLRPSHTGEVCLTREGGLCVKTNKGIISRTTEYPTLGKFGIAAVHPRKVVVGAATADLMGGE